MTIQAPGQVVWFTGLSGAGKTTLCQAVAAALEGRGRRVQLLDGDELRQGLCADLGYSQVDRFENVRRVACVASLGAKSGLVVLVALITPMEQLRAAARDRLPAMVEVFVDAPLELCEQRDPKGLYRLARAGQLSDFTGVDAPFQPPSAPDLVCCTERESVTESMCKVLAFLDAKEQAALAPLPRAKQIEGRTSTLAVDFDGVIANYEGWAGLGVLGTPRPDVVAALRILKSEGWKIVVHTTRAAEEIYAYLVAAGVVFDEINRNTDYPGQSGKPVATVYWDDRALTYSGDAQSDLARIRAFRTWNNRR